MNFKEQTEIYKAVGQKIKHGEWSWTEANKYLDSIDFPAEWRYPGVHMNDQKVLEYYDWVGGKWQRRQPSSN